MLTIRKKDVKIYSLVGKVVSTYYVTTVCGKGEYSSGQAVTLALCWAAGLQGVCSLHQQPTLLLPLPSPHAQTPLVVLVQVCTDCSLCCAPVVDSKHHSSDY